MPGHVGSEKDSSPPAKRPEPIIKPGSIAPREDTADMIARIGAEHVEHHRMQRHYKPLIGFGYVMADLRPVQIDVLPGQPQCVGNPPALRKEENEQKFKTRTYGQRSFAAAWCRIAAAGVKTHRFHVAAVQPG